MRELGVDVAALLHEHVDFLENVGDVELPEGLAVARETLLGRTRALLERAASPEPYLDMNAGRAASVADNLNGTVEEYIGAEERSPQRGSLHYYESFQEFHGDGAKEREGGKIEVDKELENLKLMYTSFSAMQAKGRAVKSGTLLHLRREKNMFAPLKVFHLNRSCWACLVGSHLLLYMSERDSHPYQVVPLRGYSCRAALGDVPRNPRRVEAAFEIFCPGERAVQFAAKSVTEMREWVDAVTASVEPASAGFKSKNRAPTFVEILELETNERACIERVKEEQEKYQGVLSSPKSKPKEKQLPPAQPPLPAKPIPAEVEPRSEESQEEAPPLPARTRRLPSLPSSQDDDTAVFETRDEPYDEEGLYHCVEEVRAQAEYQNCRAVVAMVVQETYDDVEGATGKDETLETYDDVQTVMKSAKEEPISYDDVHTVASNLRAKPDKSEKSEKADNKSEKPEKPWKPQQKRSFLGRMYKRKESMRKDDRKPKSPTTPTPPATPTTAAPKAEELPCYDDVSSLSSPAPAVAPEENYLTPPPPRPIYSQPPAISKCVIMPPEEIYDDIGSCIEVSGNGCPDCAHVDVIKNYPHNGSILSDLQLSIEQEHYQVPKSGLRRVVEQQQQHQQQEELYDDVALSETFKSKQRDSLVASPERSVWSRISGSRRQTVGSSDPVPNDDPKVRPLQKLFSKVETTLGKAAKVNGVAN